MEREDPMEIESEKSGQESASDFDLPEQHRPTNDDFDEDDDSDSQDEFLDDFIENDEDDFAPYLGEEDEEEEFIEEEEEEEEDEEEEESDNEIEEESPRYSVSLRNIDDGDCQVCYSLVSAKFLQTECQHLFDLISCKSCDIKVHHICHGMSTPVEETNDDLGKSVKYFLCDSCKQTSQEKEKKCHICNNREGCLRISRDNKFVHPLCAIGSSNIAFRDVTTMDIDLSSFRKRGTTIPSVNKCRICKNKIETHRCVNEKSNIHCHLHCALRAKLLKPRKTHLKIWFSLLPEDLKFAHLVSEEAVLGNIEDLTVKLKRVIGKTGMDTTLRFPMEIKQRRKGSRYRKKVGKDRTEASIFLQELFDKAKKTTTINFEEADYQKYLEDKTLVNQEVGGRFIVIATDELTKDEREIIDEYEQEEYDEQVLLQIEGLNPFDSISEIIRNFYKEIENANSLLEVYSEDKIPKFKRNLQAFPMIERLSFPELLFFVNVFQRRVQAALNHLCDINDLQKLITSASTFPFSLTSMIQLLNKKYHTAVAADHLLAPYVSHCEPLSAYDATQKNFDGTIVASNEKAIQQAFQIRNIYTHKPCKSITQQFKDLQDSYKQLVFLKEFHSELKDYFSSNVLIPQEGLPIIPLSKLLSLYAKANRLKLDEHFEEFQLLKQLIGESTDIIGLDETQEFGETDLHISGKPSPRGTPKVGEIIPISAIPLGSHRRGRPPREDKLAAKIEKDYQLQLEHVKSFQRIQDLENELIKARDDDDQDKVQRLETTQAKVQDWQHKFRQAIRNNDASLGSLIERMESIKIYFKEMVEALRLRRDWSLWRLKVIAISRRLNKKRQKYLGDIDEMVDLDELEKVINLEQEIIHLEPTDGAFQEIKDKFNQAQQIHLQLQNEENPFSLDELKKFKQSLKENNIHIPESHSLQRRLIANENLQRLIDTPLTLKKLEEKLTYLKDTTASPRDLDSQLLQRITDKISEGKDLKLRAQAILSQAPYSSIQELKRMAQLLKIYEESNIETEETDKIQKYLNEFLKFLRAYSAITNTPLVDSRKLQSEEEIEIINETVDSLIQKCQTVLNENLDSIDEDKAEKLDELFRWFHPELLENLKLKDFFDFLSIKLWKAKARIYLQTTYPRTLSTIQKFIAEIPHIEKLTREDYTSVKNIQHVIKRINKWKEDASEVIGSYSKDKLLDLTETSQLSQVGAENIRERLDLINSKSKNLLLTHDQDFSMYSDLAEQRDQLRKITSSIDWVAFALGMKKQLEEDKLTLTYEIVKKAFEDLEKLELPQNRGICKLVVAWHSLAESLKKTFDEGYEKKRVQVVKIDVEGEEIQKLINKNKNKLRIEEANQMIQNLENGTKVISLYDEAEIIKRDINELKIWASTIKMTDDRVSTYFDNFDQQDFNRSNFEFDDINFKREINRLKVDMLNLPIRDENCERSLQLLDFRYEASVVAHNLRKDITLDEWRKIIKKGEKLNKTLENNSQLENILASLRDEIQVAERLKAFASKFKKSEAPEKLYFEEIDAALEEFNHCKIQLVDDRDVVEDSLRTARTLQEKIHDRLNSEGTSQQELNAFLSSLKDYQIDLSFEQGLLKNAIKRIEEIEAAQRRGVDWKPPTEVQKEKFIQECNQIRDKVSRENGNSVTLAEIKLKIHEGNQLRKEFFGDDRLETAIDTLQDIQTRVEQELKEIFRIKDLSRLENYSFKTNNVRDLRAARNKRKSALKPEKIQELAGPKRRGRPSKDQAAEIPKTQEKIVRPPFKPEREIIGHIQTIIEQSRFFKVNEKDAERYAKKVFHALPELLHSKEKCKKILLRLRTLLDLRNIANSILEKEFDYQHIRGFMKERLSQVKLIEQNLKQKSHDQEKGKFFKTDSPFKPTHHYSPEKIQKKIPGRELKLDRDFNNRQPQMTPIPKDSILKIFSGALEWEEINSYPRVNLYTCSDLNAVITIPSLQASSDNSTISVTNVIPWSNFQAYFSETLKKWERREKDSDVQIIAGWIEPEVSIYLNGLQRISQELNENEQVGIYKYKESSTIIILDKEQMKKQWSDRLDFRVRKVRQNSESALYFLIVHKPYKLTEASESLAPEVVEAFEEEGVGKESSRKSQHYESAPNTGLHSLAPSSLLEEETDYGVIAEEDYFAPPFPSSFFSGERSGQGETFGSPAFSGSRSQLEKRSYGRIEARDEEIDHIEQVVKKIKSGLASTNKEAVIQQLGTMQEDEVNEVAQHLDQYSRDQIVEILNEMYQVPETQTIEVEEEHPPTHHHHHKEILNEGEVEIESESPEPEQEAEQTQVVETIIIETTTAQVQITPTQEVAPTLQIQQETGEPKNPPENSEDKEDFDDFFSS